MNGLLFNTTIITDCHDANAAMRQRRRSMALFGCPADIVPVAGTIEAAGQIIDAVDAGLNTPGLVIVNVAPRDGGNGHHNGAPFCYTTVGHTHLFSTIDGYTLSLVKKLGLATTLHKVNIEATTALAAAAGHISHEEAVRIRAGQFRSLELQRIIYWTLKASDGSPQASDFETRSIADVPEAPPAIWHVDNFGNFKTTILSSEIEGLLAAKGIKGHKYRLYEHLSDVPDDEVGWVREGSSGIGSNRFAELVLKRGSAARLLSDLRPGQVLTMQ